MKIAVIAHGLHVAGGRSVAQNIISALGVVANEHQYFLVMPKGAGYECIEKPALSECLFVANEGGIFKRSFYDFFTLPKIIVDWKADLVFCLGNYGLTLKGVKQATLYHKPHFVYPEVKIELSNKEKIKNMLIHFQISRSLRYTDLVFCQTLAIKTRFIKVFKPHCDVQILPNVVSSKVKSSSADFSALPSLLKVASTDDKFKLLALTRYYAHKNLEVLVDTFDQYREELKDVTCLLTIKGEDHQRAALLIARIKRLGLTNNFVNLGTVGQETLPVLYEYSDALILPTLLESFSGTYVEAMQFQRPILTSDRDFAKAVCGKAAGYFDPFSTQDICQSILSLKNNVALRESLVEAGKARLAEIPTDWNKVVRSALQKLVSL